MFRLSLFGPFSLTDSVGSEVPLASKKARALLAYLALSPSRPRSREEILALLWSNRAEAQGRASLRQVLTGLRKAAGPDLLRIERDSVALNTDQVEVSQENGAEFLVGFHLNDPAFEEWLRDERLRLEDAPQEATTHAPASSERPVIAVLPFENLSDDLGQAFFSDGITEDIVTELSRFDEVVVISPRASFQLRSTAASPRDAGEALNAGFIVEGSIRQAGHRVRISVKLTEAVSGAQLWGERYDRELADVFDIQEEVARQIASSVPARILVHAYDRARNRKQANLTAYQHVLRAEWLSWHEFPASEVGACLERAIAADPTYARAYSRLANWHAYQVYFPFAPFEAIQSRVRQLTRRALDCISIDTVDLSYAASAHLLIGDHEVSALYNDRALKKNPNHFDVMMHAAMNFAWRGETENSLVWLERFMKAVPIAYSSSAEVTFEVFFLAEQYEAAIAGAATFPIKGEFFVELAAAYGQAGRFEEAAALRELFEASKPEGHTFEAHVEAILRTCARERERDLWREGYRKAGF